MRRLTDLAVIAAVLLAAALAQQRAGERRNTDVPRAAEQFLFVPVRVHLLRAPAAPSVGVTLTHSDIARIYRKVNEIWHAAGIHLWVESVRSESPATLSGHSAETLFPLDSLLALRPFSTRNPAMFHVYYLAAMPVNGIYIDQDGIFVQQSAVLRSVPGGIDQPLPRVTAHELGHAMGLRHRQAWTNLMASGTTGTSLNEEEVQKVRHTVESLPWAEAAPAFLEEGDHLAAEGHKAEAAGRYRALLELPGDSALKQKAQRGLEGVRG